MTTTANIQTIEGITYLVTKLNGGIYDLTKIGKRGKPVKQSRPARKRDDGSWYLGPWVRI
jgi:hypothetical protein